MVCEGGEFDGTVTPDAWREAFAELAVEQGDETVGFLSLASSPEAAGFGGGAVGDFVVAPIYVTEDVTIQGTCTSEFGTFDLDVALEAGWTLLSFTLDELDPDSGFPSRVSFRSVNAVPDGAEWYFVENEPEPAPGTRAPSPRA